MFTYLQMFTYFCFDVCIRFYLDAKYWNDCIYHKVNILYRRDIIYSNIKRHR